jgi:ABC-2 type transport system ATP-binding protein
MTRTPSIETHKLTKTYGDFTAVNDLSLAVHTGEVFGFLGPNGAGKTTTIKMLMGMLIPSSGTAQVHGQDCIADRVAVKRTVGYLPDTPVFYKHVRGHELFRFVASMHGLATDVADARMNQLFADLDLTDAASEYVMNYSMGMTKKMALSLALLHEPEVLILDEPTTGLDPMASRQIRTLIRSIADAGRTVFLSTHLLEMAEVLCDRVGILHEGQLRAIGTPAELRAQRAVDGSLEDLFFAFTDHDRAE